MNHADIVALLSGVVDKEGTAMCAAIEGRGEACVKLLMVRRGGHKDIDARAYINIAQGRDSPLLCTFDMGRFHAPRIAKFLLNQGAETTSNVQLELDEWGEIGDTPLVAATLALGHAETDTEVDDETLDGLKGGTRLLQQVDAVHAVS